MTIWNGGLSVVTEVNVQLNSHDIYDVMLQAFLFFVAIAKSGKAKDCKSFILGSNPSGDFGAVV